MKIIYFAPIEWGAIKQRPQHLAKHLAERYDFYYVQPLGLRKLKLSDFARILQRLFGFFRRNGLASKVNVKNPIFIPFLLPNKLAQKLNVWLLVKQLKKIADDETILWITSPVSIMPMLLPRLKHKVLIYEMMDDYEKFHVYLRQEIARTELLLIAQADLIIATSQVLLEKAKALSQNKNCVLVSNGVEYDFFANSQLRMPVELHAMKKIAGYVGSIDTWMDFMTVEFIAKKRQDIDFVFIGPVKVKNIPKVINLHFIGARDYATLPNYLQAFSVCLLPFMPGEFADSINPVKLYEYLACGKPIVLNDMREAREFANIVYVAKNKEDFLLKLDQALNEQNFEIVRKRKEVARQYDWSVKAKILEELLLKLLRKI